MVLQYLISLNGIQNKNKMRVAVFPGSFDPITSGHVDIVKRMLPLFDKIVIAIGNNTQKTYTFDIKTRARWIDQIFKNESNVQTVIYDNLTVDLCKNLGAHFIIRGLRNTTDFNYEMSIAQLNKSMDKDVETIFTFTSPEYGHISSTIVREIIKYHGKIDGFVPAEIVEEIYGTY